MEVGGFIANRPLTLQQRLQAGAKGSRPTSRAWP